MKISAELLEQLLRDARQAPDRMADLQYSGPDGAVLDVDQLGDVFTRWDIAYRADPHAFADRLADILAGETPEEYGPLAAATFLNVLAGKFDQ